jgi:eukaryotic-like serine/threonine-protein kinase
VRPGPHDASDEERERVWRDAPGAATGATGASARRPISDLEPGSGAASERVWPPRALAAIGAAALTLWLTTGALAPSPVPPAAVGLLAGAAILLLPRLGWGALTIALAAVAVSQHLPGAAAVITIALLVPLLLAPAAATAWPLNAAAPALGLIGLAGAWPALAGRATTPWRRAMLGAAGWIWLLLASAIAGKALYLPPVPGVAPPHAWMPSLSVTVDHLLRPEISAGVLAPALVWALAATTLPWLVRGASLTLDVVRAVVWAAIVVSGTGAVIAAVQGPVGAGGVSAPSALVGAAASAAVALAPSLLETWRAALHSDGPPARVP